MIPTDTDTFVIAWHEPPSTRLRTYTNEHGNPLLATLDEITPRPETVITTKLDLEIWMALESTDPAAILGSLVESELGWQPL